MKTNSKNLFLLSALIAGLNLLPAGRVTAQTFTTLHSFTSTTYSGPPSFSTTTSEGSRPDGSFVLSGDILYGMASQGGDSGHGTVFAVNTNGTDFRILYSFTATVGSAGYSGHGSNSD